MARNVKGTAKCNELGSIRTHSLGPAVQECAVIHCASRRMMIGVDRLALYTHQGKEGSDSEENLPQHHDIDATTRVESGMRCSHELCIRFISSRYRGTIDAHTPPGTLAPCASRWGTFGKQDAETMRMMLMSSAPRRTRLSSAAMRPREFRHCHVIRSYSILFSLSSLNSLPK